MYIVYMGNTQIVSKVQKEREVKASLLLMYRNCYYISCESFQENSVFGIFICLAFCFLYYLIKGLHFQESFFRMYCSYYIFRDFSYQYTPIVLKLFVLPATTRTSK